MSEHRATISWKRRTDDFSYDVYNRSHTWTFDNGTELAASAAPAFRGDEDRIDPEEAFVASVSACHMLTFLALASRKRFVVDSYTDRATGRLEKNDAGRLAITSVTLRPQVEFGGERKPSGEQLDRLHHQAHEHCYIANSVKTSITVEP